MLRRFIFLLASFVAMMADAYEVRLEGNSGKIERSDIADLKPEADVTVAACVKEIAPYAFAGNGNVVSVRFEEGSSLSRIGEYAFMGCTNLRSVILPAREMTIGESAFRECSALEEICIPEGVEVLPRGLMSWCERLERVSLPSTLRRIGAHVFAYCGNLRDIAFLPGLEGIGSNAFNNCVSLQEIVIPASVKELESYAFAECKALRRAVMPANGSLLGELIFSGCLALEELTELSADPPEFDCGSFLCEPDEEVFYNKCVLRVPAGSLASYRNAPGWNLVRKVESVSE